MSYVLKSRKTSTPRSMLRLLQLAQLFSVVGSLSSETIDYINPGSEVIDFIVSDDKDVTTESSCAG